jgi:hypothetical protein
VGSSFFSIDVVDEPKLNPRLAVGLLSLTVSPVAPLLEVVVPKVKAGRIALLPVSLAPSGALILDAPNVTLLISGFLSSLFSAVDELDVPNVKLVVAGLLTSSLLFSESLEVVVAPKVNSLLFSPSSLSTVLDAPKENPPAAGLLFSSLFELVAPNVKPLDAGAGAGVDEEIAPNVNLLEDSVDFAVDAPNVKVLAG